MTQQLTRLRSALRAESTGTLEKLAAALISRLVGVRVSVSNSGFQYGGDAGTAGRGGRHLRIECKRYADSTPLDNRELQGEIDDARRRTPGLELWILVSTRNASETTQETLNLKAREAGVPILVIDWTTQRGALPDLAALCSGAPDVVEEFYGRAAADAARSLTQEGKPIVFRIKQELEPWHIGFEQLRVQAQVRLLSTWRSVDESRAVFGQNAAGGAATHLVERNSVSSQLQAWWDAGGASPAVVHGDEGVGKTWAALQWVVRELPRLPITLLLSSGALPEVRGLNENGVLSFLAGVLHDLAGTQDATYWLQRLYRLLERPDDEGPAILLVVDGLNQEASFEWKRLIQILQGGRFKNRVRLLLTTQTHFLEERLRGLQFVSGRGTRVGVEPFDLLEGGELDQMLASFGKKRSDLNHELIPLARVPRLFPIVMALNADAALHGDVTVSRLLWAYGRDQLSVREGRAISETEWEQWLLDLAKAQWSAIRARAATALDAVDYTEGELDAKLSRASLEPAVNYRRLAEIIDGAWMESVPGKPNAYRPKESTLLLALGASLVALLDAQEHENADRVEAALAEWLDPISATSAAASVLAAALSISVAKGLTATSRVVAALTMALLQSQNAGDNHRHEVVALAPALTHALLGTVELSQQRAQASARQWALRALGEIPSENTGAWQTIHERLIGWIAQVTCPNPLGKSDPNGSDAHLSKRLLERIGTDIAGTHVVMGVPIRLHERQHESLGLVVPGLLLGKPLLPAMRVLVAATVTAAVDFMSSPLWEGLKWLVTLNPVDRSETVERLIALSDTALNRVRPESGVHPEVPKKVAALLLWLTGAEDQEEAASKLRVSFESNISYENDYLSDPANSLFALERRHVQLQLNDNSWRLIPRLQRADLYLGDPGLEVDENFKRLVGSVADEFDMSSLDKMNSLTAEDLNYREFEPAAARLASPALATMARRGLHSLADRSGEPRHWAALRAPHFLLLTDGRAAEAARTLRLKVPDPIDRDESFIATRLLEIELLHAPVDEQLDVLVRADNAWLTLELMAMTRPGDKDTLSRFLQRWPIDNKRAAEVALTYLATHPVKLQDEDFNKLAAFALSADESLRMLAFIALDRAQPERFGAFLRQHKWKVATTQAIREQEHGSRAILSASQARSLGDLRFEVAPWLLLSEARTRGALPSDAKVAATVLDAVIRYGGVVTEPEGVEVSIDTFRRPGLISFDELDDEDEELSLQQAFDADAQLKRRQGAQERGHQYLTSARDAGLTMAVQIVNVADARMLVEHCSAEIGAWLDGMTERTAAFRSRVNAAGGLFIALCEALLEADWRRGVELWRALDESQRTRFLGEGGINELMLIPFRVTDNPGVLQLRDEIYSLHRNGTDQALLVLATCVALNKRLPWLRAKIADDLSADDGWRQKRAIVLDGMIAEVDLGSSNWFEGPVTGTWGFLRRRAQIMALRQAIAKHWWRQFVDAQNIESAYSAWTLFVHYADRRAYAWMAEELKPLGQSDELWRLKMLHMEANRSSLESAMKKQDTRAGTDLERKLLGWDTPDRWLSLAQLSI
ncbi:MAG: hypothetical protein QM722_15725 [Piscinibacter sp.]